LTNCTFPTLNQDTTGTAAGLSSTLVPNSGGTGVANGVNNTITFTGNYSLGLTLTGTTAITLPTSGTLINDTDTAAKATNIKGGLGGQIPYQSAVDTTALLANGSAGQVLRSGGTTVAPGWSTPTFPNAATSGKVLIGDGTNVVLSTPSFPNASATAAKVIKSDGTNWVASTETYAPPGTSGNVLVSDGTNWTSATPVLNALPNLTGNVDFNGKFRLAYNAGSNSLDITYIG
jgi:hypothetical protein